MVVEGGGGCRMVVIGGGGGYRMVVLGGGGCQMGFVEGNVRWRLSEVMSEVQVVVVAAAGGNRWWPEVGLGFDELSMVVVDMIAGGGVLGSADGLEDGWTVVLAVGGDGGGLWCWCSGWRRVEKDRFVSNHYLILQFVGYIYNQCETNVAITKGVMNVRSIARQYTGNVTRKMVFGSRYFGKGNANGGQEPEDIAHSDSLVVIPLYVFSFCVTDYIPWLRWRTDFDGHERIIRNALDIARKYQDPLIDERIQQWKDGVRTEENDLLDVYINLRNPRLTSDQIKAQMLDLMLASFDNTSNCIEWAIAEMINAPSIFDKAIQELDLVVGKNRLVQESDLVHLNYVKACLREAFRLHPVSPFNLAHVSYVDTIVAGYFIPKGSHLLLSRRGLGRDPEFWDDPLKFNPDRHINGDDKVVLYDHNLHILSFGTGRRGCPGVLLGSTITTMLMARLIQGFTWELPPNEQHVDLNENVYNIWKAKPLLAVVKPRLPQHLYATV